MLNSSSLFCCSLARVEKTLGKPSSACFFHCAIWVGCTPYSAAISLAVLCPLIASKAILAFSSALYRFRCPPTVFSFAFNFSIQPFFLNHPSRFLDPLYPPSFPQLLTTQNR